MRRCWVSGVAGQLSLSNSSDVRLPSREGSLERGGDRRLRLVINDRPCCDAGRYWWGVCSTAEADMALLSFSIVGQDDGDGMMMEG